MSKQEQKKHSRRRRSKRRKHSEMKKNTIVEMPPSFEYSEFVRVIFRDGKKIITVPGKSHSYLPTIPMKVIYICYYKK
jgi:hypothetical protein